MASKKVLGRGLGAFFPDYDNQKSDKEDEATEARDPELTGKAKSSKISIDPKERVNVVLRVPVKNIRPNPHQPRREFNDERLQELSESINEHGLIQPITVRYIGEKRFELISGERRLRAAKLAGINELPAYIREVNDEDIISFALVENIQREDLNPMEIALGYQRLLEELDFTQAQVAEKVGKNRSTVANMLRLLNLPPYAQAALRDQKISMGHARALISIDDDEQQRAVYDAILEQELSVRQTEEAVRQLGNENEQQAATKSPRNKTPQSPHLKDISKRLRRTFSTSVNIKTKKKGGEIRIEYYSDDELERLLELFDDIG